MWHRPDDFGKQNYGTSDSASKHNSGDAYQQKYVTAENKTSTLTPKKPVEGPGFPDQRKK